MKRKIIFCLLWSVSAAWSATQTFVREYTYEAGEADSNLSSRAMALEQVKRALLEELGTYLESYTEVRNAQLTMDQITAMTAGVVQTQIMEEKWNGREYWLKAKVEADPDKVAADLENMKQNQSKVKELEEIKRKAEEALAENQRLKKELESAKSDQAKQQIQQSYSANASRLSAIEWFERSSFLTAVEDYQGAVEAYGKGLMLDPGFAPGFYNRGYAYNMLGRHQQAIADYDRSLALDPGDHQSYFNRALSYHLLGNFRQAVADYGQAIGLNPGDPQSYYHSGDVPSGAGGPQPGRGRHEDGRPNGLCPGPAVAGGQLNQQGGNPPCGYYDNNRRLNARAFKSYHKCGLVKDGVMRQELFRDGPYHDIVAMVILRVRDEWLKTGREKEAG